MVTDLHILGLLFLILGIVISIGAHYTLLDYYQQYVSISTLCITGDDVVDQFGGEQLKEFLNTIGGDVSNNIRTVCNEANFNKTLIDISRIIGPGMIVSGIVFSIMGSYYKKETNTLEQHDLQPNSRYSDTFVFCRYCGRKTPIKHHSCIYCNNDFDSDSQSMKQCKFCGLAVMDDSNYCGGCGNKF